MIGARQAEADLAPCGSGSVAQPPGLARLAELAPAMPDIVTGTQSCFRALLEALSRPGRIVALPDAARRGLGRPAAGDGQAFSEGLAALLLTLLDGETGVRWHGALPSPAARQWLRFHTGARDAADGAVAEFTLARAAELGPAEWCALSLGDDDHPQLGGTLIVEVTALQEPAAGQPGSSRTLALRGPGIAEVNHLAVAGMADAFWRYRQSLQPLFPRGFELVMVCGHHIAAVPRSTRITLEG